MTQSSLVAITGLKHEEELFDLSIMGDIMSRFDNCKLLSDALILEHIFMFIVSQYRCHGWKKKLYIYIVLYNIEYIYMFDLTNAISVFSASCEYMMWVPTRSESCTRRGVRCVQFATNTSLVRWHEVWKSSYVTTRVTVMSYLRFKIYNINKKDIMYQM